jgi:hypothetical protein
MVGLNYDTQRSMALHPTALHVWQLLGGGVVRIRGILRKLGFLDCTLRGCALWQ